MIYNSLLLCEKAIMDARSNNISLINLIEEIRVMGLPALFSHLAIVARLQKEAVDVADQYQFEIRIRNNQRQLFTQPVMANFMGRPKTRLLLDLNGLLITENGTIVVELLRDGGVVISSSIDIRLPERPQVAQTQ